MGYLFYDPDSHYGYYMSDKDFRDACGIMGRGVTFLVVFYLICAVIIAILFTPVFALLFLDDFVEGFIFNNAGVFLFIGALIAVLRCLPKFPDKGMIRTVFNIYIVISTLYILLYVLHMDTPFYAILKLLDDYLPDNADRTFIELFKRAEINFAISGNWFYELSNKFVGWAVDILGNLGSNLFQIDNSSLNVPAGEIDVLEMLKTIGAYIGWGGLAIVVYLFVFAVSLTVAVFTIALPYIITLSLMVAVNKLVYIVRTREIRGIKKREDYEKNIRIHIDELKTADRCAPSKAVEIYARAAEAGNPYAQFLYAQALSDGTHVLLDEKAAFSWYRKAAMQNMATAQYLVAVAYFAGIGTGKSKALAKAWLMKALQNKDFQKNFAQSPEVRETTAKIMKKTKFADCF